MLGPTVLLKPPPKPIPSPVRMICECGREKHERRCLTCRIVKMITIKSKPTCMVPCYDRISTERWGLTMNELELLVDYDGENFLLFEQENLLKKMKKQGYKGNDRIVTAPFRSNPKKLIPIQERTIRPSQVEISPTGWPMPKISKESFGPPNIPITK